MKELFVGRLPTQAHRLPVKTTSRESMTANNLTGMTEDRGVCIRQIPRTPPNLQCVGLRRRITLEHRCNSRAIPNFPPGAVIPSESALNDDKTSRIMLRRRVSLIPPDCSVVMRSFSYYRCLAESHTGKCLHFCSLYETSFFLSTNVIHNSFVFLHQTQNGHLSHSKPLLKPGDPRS